jgi:membrane-associated phospholipid phosphatase
LRPPAADGRCAYGAPVCDSPAATDSDHRDVVTSELWGDLKFIARDRTFYVLMAGLHTVPVIGEDLLEREPLTVNRSWSKSTLAEIIFEPGEIVGNGAAVIGASALLHGAGKLAHAPGLSAVASDLIRAHAVNALLTTAIKRSINRPRPDGSPFSYPSGHTSEAFAAAGVIAHHTGTTWGWVARGGATLIALSRLQENVHYTSDLVAGAILGSYVAGAVTGRPRSTTALKWDPWIDGKSVGARFSLSLP